jgi:hypothetical protein
MAAETFAGGPDQRRLEVPAGERLSRVLRGSA